MRLIRTGVPPLAALLAIAFPVSARQPSAKPAQPSALPASAQSAAATVDAFHAALHCGDARSAAALLADDALIFEEGGVERSKAEYVAHHLPADAAFSRIIVSSVTRHAGGANGTLAWDKTHDDQLIWDMVAFVRQLPNMSPEQYKAAVASAPADHDEMMKQMMPGMTGASNQHNTASEPHEHPGALGKRVGLGKK